MSKKSARLDLAIRVLTELEKEKPKPQVRAAVPSIGTRMAAAQKAAMTRAGAAPAKTPKRRPI